MADDPFPDWSKPATKGDVVRAMVFTRAVASALARAMLAQRRGDIEAANAALNEWSMADDVLNKLIYEIGGRENGQ
jgi:hypothetical protein